MHKIQKRQCDDVQWEHELECLGPKRNRVLGDGKRASDRVNRRCDERLLETLRDVVAPGLAASEERHGAGRLRHHPCKAARTRPGHPAANLLVFIFPKRRVSTKASLHAASDAGHSARSLHFRAKQTDRNRNVRQRFDKSRRCAAVAACASARCSRSDAGILDRPVRPVRDQLDQLHQDNAESGWCTG